MRIHLIATGGAAMHNMAIALHKKGHRVTGSDDQIFEPSLSRLKKYGLLPEQFGWDKNIITTDIDAVILGMHARENNPELLEAQRLGLNIYSYPEYIYQQSKEKTRIVIAGSHGKTTITSMILHVLNHLNMDFDYMVGAQLEGFDTMVKLTDAPIIIIEGDEYLSSPIDRRPKFIWYKPQIALISGVAWDHINVFPTYEMYVEQFDKFMATIEEGGHLVYYKNDKELKVIAPKHEHMNRHPYDLPKHKIEDHKTVLNINGEYINVNIFGDHNLENLMGAQKVTELMGISEYAFFNAIKSFTGAAKRLEKIAENETSVVFKDFAHSPSKLTATVSAVKKQYADKTLVAIVELHTFSSLNKNFISEYKGALTNADKALVYYNPKTVEHKKLEPISVDEMLEAFAKDGLIVSNKSEEVKPFVADQSSKNTVFLIMTSGNFDGINIDDWGKEIVG